MLRSLAGSDDFGEFGERRTSATLAGYDQGETFTRLGDAMADDIDLAAGVD